MSSYNQPLTTSEAATRLGLKPAIIRRYCLNGRLKSRKVGRDWLIPEQALIEFASQPRKVGRPSKKRSR